MILSAEALQGSEPVMAAGAQLTPSMLQHSALVPNFLGKLNFVHSDVGGSDDPLLAAYSLSDNNGVGGRGV